MTLARRLWIWSVALPVVVLLAAFAAADAALRVALAEGLDRALMTQAAVESVSLFDDGTPGPHLHMADSPLEKSVLPFAPKGMVFGPDGVEVLRYPDQRSGGPRDRVEPAVPGEAPVFAYREEAGQRWRDVTVGVNDPDGTVWTLRLSASLAQLDQSLALFRWIGALTALAAAGALALAQTLLARGLRARLENLRAHLHALEQGDLERPLPADDGSDEVAALRVALAAATERLKQARGAQDRLVADAAHELRTPLTLMRTTLDLALRRERSHEELKEALTSAREEVDRLAALATRLLDLAAARGATHELQDVDAAALCAEAIDAVRARGLEVGVDVTLEAAGAVHARVHAGTIRQALDNLLDNALRFAPRGTAVQVQCAQVGALVRLAVADQGPGIPEAERELVFEPFHRLSRGQGGAGLGLAIVRDVATRHGGKAFVAPTAVGATVAVEVPVAGPGG